MADPSVLSQALSMAPRHRDRSPPESWPSWSPTASTRPAWPRSRKLSPRKGARPSWSARTSVRHRRRRKGLQPAVLRPHHLVGPLRRRRGRDGPNAGDWTREADAIEFVKDAFKHCKAIAATGSGIRLLQAADIPVDGPKGDRAADAATVVGDRLSRAVITQFLAAIAGHRLWSREPQLHLPARVSSQR